jgi:CheY-like chemotaxis protein/HPt (histidine-containing phosphotransfer) domain-containing protein
MSLADSGLPRVVLVDDDPAIRRLVALVLEDEPLTLVCCASVAEAREALRAGAVQLLLTDLMMPGETGHDLLQQLRGDTSLARPARVAVFSAGLDKATLAQLDGQGVWRLLSKPVAVAALLDAVREALSGGADALPAQQPVSEAGSQPGSQPGMQPVDRSAAAAPPAVSRSSRQQLAIAEHFSGDAALFHAFRGSCGPVFSDDLLQGDAAWTQGDVAALRRLGHSLKSVLRSLGENEAADAAQALDRAAQAAAALAGAGREAEMQVLQAAWARLRQALQQVLAELPVASGS